MDDSSACEWDLPDFANYSIKTFGASMADCQFHRLPRVIEAARRAIPDEKVVGFFACALEISPRMTGLIFCDNRHGFPEGLPAHTPPLKSRYRQAGYDVVVAQTGGHFVVAHWLYQNGARGPFYNVQ
jgi:hypothetical protein